VTTRTLERIAERSGCQIVGDELVGFKYIAHVLESLEKDGSYGTVRGHSRDLILAAEESHGVLLTPEIRDKDAAGGALLLCELLGQLQSRGQHLPEYLDRLILESGNYRNASRGVVMRGIQGVQHLAGMMQSLRSAPPGEFDGMKVVRATDFLDGSHGPIRSESERLSRNLLIYDFEAARVIIRPSGTEPKAKIYVELECGKVAGASSRAAGVARANRLGDAVLQDCIHRIGYRLSASALLLPDNVDLELKRDFDSSLRLDVQGAAERSSQDPSWDLAAWLRERLEPYGAGADPLEGTAPAVAHMLNELAAAAGPETGDVLRSLEHNVRAQIQPAAWFF
jgi:hypothetical protein